MLFVVAPGTVRLRGEDDLARRVGDRHFGVGDDATRRVNHRPANGAIHRLGFGRGNSYGRKHEAQAGRCQNSAPANAERDS